ncbi:MAG: UDP-3-O-(3-hydroxymyristoyl)glucosamine N-acyltransferase [Deltaproteobacteria bacterium]|jgi:UDP-3-O-[3-hydroxymyristoyl] glucosamine N-acyltransferase|nr:UDP-3-O-(3-hydroxymyristoyl)glucosamine N-acyltransferase [Deltaproteobacteria bacterium]
MIYKLQDIANKLNAELIGDGNLTITGINPLQSASEQDLSFFSPKTEKNTKDLLKIATTKTIGAVLVKKYIPEIKSPQIITANPLHAIIGLASLFHKKPPQPTGIHPSAIIHATAKLGTNVSVGALAVIGEKVVIGDNTTIHPHVVIYPFAQIGNNCVLHASSVIREYVKLGNNCLIQNGTVIGSDGFGYVPDTQTGHKRLVHIGTVELEDYVDVGANTTIDNGMIGKTKIGFGSKLDNLVQVGHNVQIGKACLLCAQVGISGSSVIGNNVVLAGQVGVADHTTIGDNTRAGAQSGIPSDIPANLDVMGYPAIPASNWRRVQVIIKKLPELLKRLHELEKKVLKTPLIIFLIGLTILTACSGNTAQKKGIFTKSIYTDEQIFEYAQKSYADEDYNIAINNYNELLDSYPTSKFAITAELKIADAYFLDENYLEAQYAYEQFIANHPWNSNLPYVRHRLGLCFLKQYNDELREQLPILTALKHFQEVITLHPESEYAAQSSIEIEHCRNMLADYELQVAKFYLKQNERTAALKRLSYIQNFYSDTQTVLLAKQLLEKKFTPEEIEASRQVSNKIVRDKLQTLIPAVPTVIQQ